MYGADIVFVKSARVLKIHIRIVSEFHINSAVPPTFYIRLALHTCLPRSLHTFTQLRPLETANYVPPNHRRDVFA